MNEINFCRLPHGLKCSIYEKFNYNQFSLFESCCNFSYLFSKNQKKINFPFKAKYFWLQKTRLMMAVEPSLALDSPKFVKIPKNSKVLFSAEEVGIAVPLTNEICALLPKLFHKIQNLRCKSTINCSEIVLQKLAEGFPIKILGFLHPPNDFDGSSINLPSSCEIDVRIADSQSIDNIFQFKAGHVCVFKHSETPVTIISKVQENTLMRQNIAYTRFYGKYTEDEVDEALLQLGVNYKFYGYNGVDERIWTVTRENEWEPSTVIYHKKEYGLAVSSIRNFQMPTAPITYTCLDYVDEIAFDSLK